MKLVRMSQKNYEKYIIGTIKEYAAEKTEAGTWPASEALQLAKEEYRRLLPEGLATKDNYFYTFEEDGETIGYLWFANNTHQPGNAFIYDFAIDTVFQNKGFGTQALGAIFIEARKLGFKKIGLHVFGQNTRAIHVYQKLGFTPTDITMSRDL
ncbi:GNAT family N-acetyltransferase [Liquorilactobacillus capillatus]|uniref:Acetyltransferase n=1 Tax=Liquorilactobacillus capillatus DSM 19910 TaxID=1423731 RepID=A0A0R1LZN7_9LACO|nr:GNAT family N-acetyltransferase [Liquorilactobacillus capillatus]KRL01095.1 acetyltransferase [Liquorilactobacillus capillatus DSM 19910]